MTQQTLALAVARQLASWGVKTVFGVTGDDILPLLDAIAEDGRIRYIGAADESGAAFMASYWAKMTGELGVCVSSAAGTVKLLQGLADAYLDGAPVLAITGQVCTSKIGLKASQYYNQQRLFSAFADYSELVANAQSGIRVFFEAASRALLKNTVCHLTVPKDTWSLQVSAEPAVIPGILSQGGKDVTKGGIAGDLDRATGLMQSSRRPLLVIGKKARGMRGHIQRLIASWQPAVIVAQDAKGVIPDTWPEVIGGVGQAWTPAIVADADCVLIIGAANFEDNYLPKVPIIQVETAPELISDIYLWDSLAGDIGFILSNLAQRLDGHFPEQSWLERIAAARKERHQFIQNDLAIPDRPIHPARLMATLNQVVSEEAIIALDSGAFIHWFDRDFQAVGQRILVSPNWSSMGAGLPAAIAAQLRFERRQVLALVGDGGMLMSFGELATARKYSLPITVVVVNNHLYGLEKDKTLRDGLRPLGLEVDSPDFGSLATASGIRGFTVQEPKELDSVLEEALSLREPTLVDVVCADVRLPEMFGMRIPELVGI